VRLLDAPDDGEPQPHWATSVTSTVIV